MTHVRFNQRNCMPARTSYPASTDMMSWLFNDFGNEYRERSVPSANIVETKEDFRIEIEAPGFSKTDFNIKLDGPILNISGEREASPEIQDEKYIRREFRTRSFSRNFRLSNWVDSSSIAAKFENGILLVTIPKVEEAKSKPAREIEIG